MKRKLLIIILLFLFICGCGKKSNSNNTKKVKTEEIEVEEKEKLNVVDTSSNSRSFAVVINNFPSAVKVQTGLSDAYMIYEIPVEGGMTRSLAFFKDKYPTKIGTVRSARHNFLDYVMENDAIFVHFGWSHYAEDQIPELGINNLDGNTSDPGPFHRENPESLAYEHTAYGNLELVKQRAKEKGYDLTTNSPLLLKYSSKNVDLGAYENSLDASNINIFYSDVYGIKYEYDKEKMEYKRYVNDVIHTDYFTKDLYTFKNIILVQISYEYTDDNYYLDIHNIGTGDGYYITNGKAIKIKWDKKDRKSKTIYKDLDGNEISVNDGKTIIMLHPNFNNIAIN